LRVLPAALFRRWKPLNSVPLSEEPDARSEFCVGGEKRRLENPDFKELLAFVNEAEELFLSGQELGGR
jgi:hypothetical protein